MIHIVKKEKIDLSNNQLTPFFDSIMEDDKISAIDKEIKEKIRDVFRENRGHRFDEKYIVKKIDKIVKENPKWTKVKDAEELYIEYKEFLHNKAKIRNILKKLIPICEQWEYFLCNDDFCIEKISSIISEHKKLVEEPQKIKNLEFLIEKIKTSESRNLIEIPSKEYEFTNPLWCLLIIAEKCDSEKELETFWYLYNMGIRIQDESDIEKISKRIKEKDIKYFQDKAYLFKQYKRIRGNIRPYELWTICNILDWETNYKEEKMQIENAFTTAAIISEILKTVLWEYNRNNDYIETLLDPFYISELNIIDVWDILFVVEKIKQTLKSWETKQKNEISLWEMISLISLIKRQNRYTNKRIQEMDIKINDTIEDYSDIIKEMFFYIYERSEYPKKYSHEKDKEEENIIKKYNGEQLENKIPNIKDICKDFNIEIENKELYNSTFSPTECNSKEISELYYIYKHPELQKFIKENFKIEKLKDLTETIQEIRIQKERGNRELIEKIDAVKPLFTDKINIDAIDVLLYEEYSLEYIQWLVQLKEETWYNIAKGIEEYHHASSKLWWSIKERFKDQKLYQKAKEIWFFTELDDKSGEYTSNVYQHRRIKELIKDEKFLNFLLENKDLNIVNLAMDYHIDEDVRVDSKQVHRNHLKDLYDQENTTGFKFMNLAKKIGLIKKYDNNTSYRNQWYTKIIQNRSKIKSIWGVFFWDIDTLEEGIEQTEICESIREISWKDKLETIEDIGKEFLNKNLSLSEQEKVWFLNVAKEYVKEDKIENLQLIIKEFVEKNTKISNKEKIDFLEETKRLKHTDLEDIQWVRERYPEITTKELPLIIEFLIRKEELEILKTKYPNMTLEELVDFNKILTENCHDRMEVLNCLDFYKEKIEEGVMLIGLKWQYMPNIKKTFENIKNIEAIDEENRMEIISLYSAIEYYWDNNHKEIPPEIELSIKEVFKQENIKNRDFVYNKIKDILNKILDSWKSALNNKEIACIEIINKKWTLNLPLIENLVKFIYELNKTLDKQETFDTTKTSIKERIKKFLQKQKNRSNEDFNDFYYISKNIIKSAPSIYNKVLWIIEQLEPSNLKYFYNQILPLYNTELVLQERKGKHEINTLLSIHTEIKTLAKNIKESKDKKKVLEEEKNNLTDNIKMFFKEKFWIIKIPETISEENIESIRRHSLYLANMSLKTKEKETILWFFLALKINDKRREFREWKEIDIQEFMIQEKLNTIHTYMEKKQSLDILKDYEKDNKENFMKIMQESEISNLRWNTENIWDRISNIDKDITSLLEDDFYGKEEQIIKKHLIQHEDLGNTLWLKYQEKPMSEEQTKAIRQLEDNFGTKLDKNKIEDIQKLMKWVSPVINFVKKIKEMELAREVEEFEKLRIPNKQLIEIFNKLGENFSDKSWMMGIIEQVRSIIIKTNEDTIILTQEEKILAYEYLKKVNKELMDLYDIKDKVENLFITFKKTSENSNNESLKNRLREINQLFTKIQEWKRENIYSMMTSNFDIIIKNIRACLWCMTPECNNDTNLSFGTNNRFFITTNNKESDQSYADEIVTLLPSSEWLVFVMEQVYGKRTPDVLVNNTLAVVQKIKKIHDKKIGVVISKTTLIGCNLLPKYLETKIKETWTQCTIQDIEGIELKIPAQPIWASYYELGEWLWGRISIAGETKLSGIIIYLN